VPFDNVRKLIALHTADERPLPGTTGTDFFEHFLEYGTGGTCWSTSNALYEVLVSVGFTARRVAGSMRDQGFVTHGTVKVTLDDMDWLVDSSILSNIPLPVRDTPFISDNRVFTAEIEPTDALHLVWYSIPPNAGYTPCRLLVDHIDHAFHSAAYEKSRTFGAFNQHIYARRNFPDLMLLMRGPVLYRRTPEGTTQEALSRESMLTYLSADFGIAESMITRWVDAGGLDATFEPFRGPPPVVPPSTPPSSRR
jgi:N-hydroxyarylamine O-acetyltransferase